MYLYCFCDCIHSTWLTVMMAVSRYIAVCHPLHARSFINQRGTRITILAVWIGSFAINLPRFWHYEPKTLPCALLGLSVIVPPDCRCVYYQKLPGELFRKSGFASAYTAVWATVAIFVPLVAMVICNWCLVRALRKSSAMQQRCCRISSTVSTRMTLTDSTRVCSNRNDSVFISGSGGTMRTPSSAGHRITPTLVALVVLFVVLVGPSEILTFAKDYVMTKQVKRSITNFGGSTGRVTMTTESSKKRCNYTVSCEFVTRLRQRCVSELVYRVAQKNWHTSFLYALTLYALTSLNIRRFSN